MQDFLQSGFILHKKPYGETSLLLDVFTAKNGKIRLIAKGANGKKSRNKGIMQVFTPLILNYTGQSNLKTLTHIEATSINIPLTNLSLYSAFYINELLLYLLEEGTPFPKLFAKYLQLLTELAQIDKNIEPLLRKFELELLCSIGYGIDFNYCANQEEINHDLLYQYIFTQGFVPIEYSNQQFLIFQGDEIKKIALLDFRETIILKKTKLLNRYILQQLLGNKKLKSRELFLTAKTNHILP